MNVTLDSPAPSPVAFSSPKEFATTAVVRMPNVRATMRSEAGGERRADAGAHDGEDVERVLAGDVDAFAGIVSRWQKPLINLAFRFCRDRVQAEEMAQEALVRAFLSLRQWRRDAAFSTWLYAVSLNLFRTRLRRAPVDSAPLDHDVVPARGLDPERTLAVSETEELVRRTVNTLPFKYREALILFYFLDQDVNEASRALGVAAGTVKARLHRGRELLRARLAPLLHETRGPR